MKIIEINNEKVIQFPDYGKLIIERISKLEADEFIFLITTDQSNAGGQLPGSAIITNDITINGMKLIFS